SARRLARRPFSTRPRNRAKGARIGQSVTKPSRSYIVGASINSCPLRKLAKMHAMRAISIIAILLLLLANALELLPVGSPFEPYLSGGALVLGLVVLVTILLGGGPERETRAAAEAARPVPVPTAVNHQADAEIV